MEVPIVPYEDGSGSPTQVNEGRSYDRYEDPASLPSMRLQPTQDHNGADDDVFDRSLGENDTGAVNFDSLDSGGLDYESPMTKDDDRRRNGLSHFFNNSDADQPPAAPDLPPDTPGPPKNPFAGRVQTPLLAGSQLFAQTPFSAAAAFKQASPTSSRPSPSHLPVQPLHTTTPHAGISSALKPRFSTSNFGEETPLPIFNDLPTSSQSRFDGTTPFPAERAGSAPLLQSSPTNRKRRLPAPIAEYEPMRMSQERRKAVGLRSQMHRGSSSGSEDDVNDVSQQRRRLVRQKREAGTRMLSTISMSGPTFKDDIVEVPASTKKERRPRSKGKQPSSRPLEICPESDPRVVMEDRTAAKDLTDVPTRHLSGSETTYEELSFPQSMIDAYNTKNLPATRTPSSLTASLPEIVSTADKARNVPQPPRSSLTESEAIPETSPAGKQPNQPTVNGSSAPAPPASASVERQSPTPRQQSPSSSPRRDSQHNQHAKGALSLLSQGKGRSSDADATTSSPPFLMPPALSTRSQRGKAHGENRISLASVSSIDRSASTLSSLSSTPSVPSREGTPITANDSDLSTRGSDKRPVVSVEENDASPGASRTHRGRRAAGLPTLKSVPRNPMRPMVSNQRQPSPFRSGSTDELARSPAFTPAFEQSRRGSRKAAVRSLTTRSSALSVNVHRQGSSAPGLFENMAFAISFQPQRPGESHRESDDREQQARILGQRIQEAGGRLLEDGLQELFEVPPVLGPPAAAAAAAQVASPELRLRSAAAATGFTALIADGHSRKAKYMEALALGLPCLAAQWVTHCLDRGALMDWAPYLLCAGESSYLGGAIRSRSHHLTLYDAAAARLADVIQGRPKLLEGVSIMLVLRKADETKQRKSYVFLAHALGAHLTRAHSLEEARDQLRAKAASGFPYDWVYTDGRAPALPKQAGKKRKRSGTASASSSAELTQLESVRTLSDERVIQSIIFGEFIEEDDLGT